MPARISDFFLPQNTQTGSETQPVSYSLGKGVCFLGVKQLGMKLAIHLHLVPRLRMSWVMPFLHQYVFMAHTGTTLPLPLLLPENKFHPPKPATIRSGWFSIAVSSFTGSEKELLYKIYDHHFQLLLQLLLLLLLLLNIIIVRLYSSQVNQFPSLSGHHNLPLVWPISCHQ